jgi:hypothetical protein
MAENEMVVMSTADFRQRKIAESLEAAANQKLDHTVPGGRYLIGGVLVNANGEPIKEETEEDGSPVRANAEEMDAMAQELEELRAKVREMEKQDSVITGREGNQIPSGPDSEPFLSQMGGGAPFVGDQREQAVEEDQQPDNESFQELMALSMRDLTEMAKEKEVDLTGVRNKSDLASRIAIADAKEEVEE